MDSLPDIPHRVVTDITPPNRHGKSLIDFLKCTNLCMLNGRSKEGCGYTSVSTKGLAVVDYCLNWFPIVPFHTSQISGC